MVVGPVVTANTFTDKGLASRMMPDRWTLLPYLLP
jgi:hypothetical protein